MAARRRRLLRVALAAALVAILAAPAAWGGLGDVDTDDERDVGAQVDAAIQAQVPLIDDPVVLGFVQNLGQRLVAGIEPQPFIYRFRVIPDSSLNAFALPGGTIYLHSATILQAATVDELAGVLGHEVAHVKGRHYARGVERTFWPALLTRAAGLAAALATGEGGVMAAAEGVNVALQLKYTREFESEADDLGAAFAARAGFDPDGMGRFFERILAADRPGAIEVPPYLYSHPDLEDRMDAVRARSSSLTRGPPPPEQMLVDFRDAQVRLGLLVESGRTRWAATAPYDRSRTDPLLADAAEAEAMGAPLDALEVLAAAERAEPRDPRPPFRRAEILLERGEAREASLALRRALEIDPSVGLAWYQLGVAQARLANRHNAVYCFEQAQRRFGNRGAHALRAAVAVQALSDPPLLETAVRGPGDEEPRARFGPGDEAVVWWARIDARYDLLWNQIRVRWIAPSGRVHAELAPTSAGRREIESALTLPGAEDFGIWRVEAVLAGLTLDQHTFHYVPAGPSSSSR